jgi:coenzyme Q-binding protein COQ10
MPTLEVSERVRAPIDKVWATVCAVEAYPQLMKPVRDVRVLEDGDNWAITAWEVELKGSILKWTEREERDPKTYRVAYHQVDGDLELFRGGWALTRISDDVTEAKLVVEFEIGIPMLRDMLNPVATRALTDNARIMLLSLGPRVE